MEVFLTEEILTNYRLGGGPGVCKTLHLPMEVFSNEDIVREKVLELVKL